MSLKDGSTQLSKIVHENIEYFSDDLTKITLFDEQFCGGFQPLLVGDDLFNNGYNPETLHCWTRWVKNLTIKGF